MKFYPILVKGHIIFDLSSLIFGLRIIPGGITFDIITDDNMIIMSLAFPGAYSVFVAFLEVFIFDGFRWKIMVAFDDNCLIALRQNPIIA